MDKTATSKASSATCADCKRLRKQVSEQKKALRRLSDAVLVFLHHLDNKIGPDKRIPEDLGRLLAKLVNGLDMVNDSVRYGQLGVDYQKDDKEKAVKQAMRRADKKDGESVFILTSHSRKDHGDQEIQTGSERDGGAAAARHAHA